MPPFGAAFFVGASPELLRSGRGSNPAESRFGDEAPYSASFSKTRPAAIMPKTAVTWVAVP